MQLKDAPATASLRRATQPCQALNGGLGVSKRMSEFPEICTEVAGSHTGVATQPPIAVLGSNSIGDVQSAAKCSRRTCLHIVVSKCIISVLRQVSRAAPSASCYFSSVVLRDAEFMAIRTYCMAHMSFSSSLTMAYAPSAPMRGLVSARSDPQLAACRPCMTSRRAYAYER